MSQPIIVWFRNDLRLHDNAALHVACMQNHPIIAVLVFDEQQFTQSPLGFDRMGKHRWNYWQKAVQAFQIQLQQMGGDLLVFKGNTVETLTTLYHHYRCHAIVAHHEFAHEEIAIENALKQQVNLELVWGNMLFAPGTIPMPTEVSPFYYTAFKNKVTALKSIFHETASLSDIRFMEVDRASLPIKLYAMQNVASEFEAGEINALHHLHQYVQSPHLQEYQHQREMLFGHENASTRLSPFLATGALSPIRIFNQLAAIMPQDDDTLASITKLKEQLIWRDYYRWLFLRYGKKIFRRTGLRTIVPMMHNDKEAFDQWRLGQTDEPLINALMTELNQSGWMSNRGRMIAAYYLSKVLKVNWLWGARWFESQLIDYDVCNNYGNWAYQSGTGTDSRINRRFNIDKQIQKFDPEKKYLRQA